MKKAKIKKFTTSPTHICAKCREKSNKKEALCKPEKIKK
jgi:hypothetical protein